MIKKVLLKLSCYEVLDLSITVMKVTEFACSLIILQNPVHFTEKYTKLYRRGARFTKPC